MGIYNFAGYEMMILTRTQFLYGLLRPNRSTLPLKEAAMVSKGRGSTALVFRLRYVDHERYNSLVKNKISCLKIVHYIRILSLRPMFSSSFMLPDFKITLILHGKFEWLLYFDLL
jgi:hypothetical protein